jgi:outer membrane murein-binding lipoprotein Lpp
MANPINHRLIIGAVLSAVTLTGCGVSRSHFDAVQATNQQLQTKNAQLRQHPLRRP